MRLTFFIFLMVSLFSCSQKKGCTYPDAINFDAEAEEDDGSCEFSDTSTAISVDTSTNQNIDTTSIAIDTTSVNTDTVVIDYEVQPGNGVIDVDGNSYKTIIIGGNEWMAENLKVKRTSSETDLNFIPVGSTDDGWYKPSYCYPNNDSVLAMEVGILYNHWSTGPPKATHSPPFFLYCDQYTPEYCSRVDVCPAGWKIPEKHDWDDLYEALRGISGDLVADGKSKNKWPSGDKASGISGFDAVPTGIKKSGTGSFSNVLDGTVWWSNTWNYPGSTWSKAYTFSMFANNASVTSADERSYCAIRCIKK